MAAQSNTTNQVSPVAGKTSPLAIAPQLNAIADESKPYTIQVASYKDVKYAEKEAVGLKKKGYETLIMAKGDYSILCVGKFPSKDEASSFARRLKSQYKDYVVRRM